MHALASSGSALSASIWAYPAIFGAALTGWGGVPGIGGTVVAAATVAASQGKLNIAGVLVAAVLGVEAGGLAGYSVGARWGRALLGHPGPLLARRQKVLAGGEARYAKWGRLAVFFTPCLVSGIARMRYSQFVIWNFLAGVVHVVAVGLTAVLLGRRYHRRHKARPGRGTPASRGGDARGARRGPGRLTGPYSSATIEPTRPASSESRRLSTNAITAAATTTINAA
jgi:membrane protein DedA with SNARE-associated domain